jgi:hypothetical protein
MNRRTRIVLGVAALGAAVGLGYAVRAARASGIPATGALSYAGVLEDANGPITGTHNLQVSLYDAATNGNLLCQFASAPVSVTNGHFSVPLPDTCTTAIGANANTWIDIVVDGADTGRAAVGAVPYAVEANHAVNADNASNAKGPLATQITQLQGVTHPPSAFHAILTNPTTIPSNVSTTVVFNSKDYDLASEYSATTGVFTATNDGYYIVNCGVEFWSLVGTTLFNVDIQRSPAPDGGTSTEVAVGEFEVSNQGNTRIEANTPIHLHAGDNLWCGAYQNSPASVTLAPASEPTFDERNSFSAFRVY